MNVVLVAIMSGETNGWEGESEQYTKGGTNHKSYGSTTPDFTVLALQVMVFTWAFKSAFPWLTDRPKWNKKPSAKEQNPQKSYCAARG